MGVKLFAVLLVLAPAIAIDIKIKAATNPTDSTVQVEGSSLDIISDTERNTFQLSDARTKDAVTKYFGKRPDDVYLRSPTPWGDLYTTYGWQQVTTTLSPQKGRIVSQQCKPTIVMTQNFENNSSKNAEFKANIHQTVSNTISSSWNRGGELTVGQNIEYGVEFDVLNVGGATSFSYTSNWGQSNSKTEEVTVGSEAGVDIKLRPYQAVVAELTASRCTLVIQVDYEASLSGYIAVNYKSPYQAHHFWALGVNSVMSSGGMPTTMSSSETIKIDFYADSNVVIRDSKMMQ